jgi:hypothetical protein
MITSRRFNLREKMQGGGEVQRSGNTSWRLEIPPGEAGTYRLAQLDDYSGIARSTYPWSAPVRVRLNARASSRKVPGTWGFGWWNDPFGLTVIQGGRARFPTLPNAAWFFFASDSNYLSLRDDLPGNGQLAAAFQSPGQLPINLVLGLPLFSLIFIPPLARRLRHWLRHFVKQDSGTLDINPTEWHSYEIDWRLDRVSFRVDGRVIQETGIVPREPLGLVIWIDNQYASWLPDGHIGYGTLANPETAWLQIDGLELTPA